MKVPNYEISKDRDFMPPRAPTLFEVPPDTDEVPCKGPTCKKTVFWIKTKKGFWMAVDCHAGAGCRPPALSTPGYGVAHWGTCADAEYFRRQAAEKQVTRGSIR